MKVPIRKYEEPGITGRVSTLEYFVSFIGVHRTERSRGWLYSDLVFSGHRISEFLLSQGQYASSHLGLPCRVPDFLHMMEYAAKAMGIVTSNGSLMSGFRVPIARLKIARNLVISVVEADHGLVAQSITSSFSNIEERGCEGVLYGWKELYLGDSRSLESHTLLLSLVKGLSAPYHSTLKFDTGPALI